MDLQPVAASDYACIKSIYHEAFPIMERSPFWFLTSRYHRGVADFWKIIDDKQEEVGFIYIVKHADLAYIYLFAIGKQYRGGHYGTHAVQAVLEKYKGMRVYLALENWEAECSNKEQRIKRHEFYKFCGFHDLPYELEEDMIKYRIMGIGDKIEPAEHKALTDEFLGAPLKFFIDMKIKKNNHKV